MVFYGPLVGTSFGSTPLLGAEPIPWPPGPVGPQGERGEQGPPGEPGVTDTYTRTEINDAIGSQVQGILNIVPTYQELQEGLATKADVTNTYSKATTDSLLSAKADQLSLNATLNTFDIQKADRASTYTVSQVDGLLANKANSANVFTKTESQQLLQLNNLAVPDYVIAPVNVPTWTVATTSTQQLFSDVTGQRLELQDQAYMTLTPLRPGYGVRVQFQAKLVDVSALAISVTDGVSWNSVAGSQLVSLDSQVFKTVIHDFQVPLNGSANLHFGSHGNSDIDPQPVVNGAHLLLFDFKIAYRGIENLWADFELVRRQVKTTPLTYISFHGTPSLHDNDGLAVSGNAFQYFYFKFPSHTSSNWDPTYQNNARLIIPVTGLYTLSACIHTGSSSHNSEVFISKGLESNDLNFTDERLFTCTQFSQSQTSLSATAFLTAQTRVNVGIVWTVGTFAPGQRSRFSVALLQN